MLLEAINSLVYMKALRSKVHRWRFDHRCGWKNKHPLILDQTESKHDNCRRRVVVCYILFTTTYSHVNAKCIVNKLALSFLWTYMRIQWKIITFYTGVTSSCQWLVSSGSVLYIFLHFLVFVEPHMSVTDA